MKGSKLLSICLLFFFQFMYGQKTEEDIIRQVSQIKKGYAFPENSWIISLEGDTVSLQSLKGKWTLIDFWSVGCAPCVEAFPILKSVSEQNAFRLNVIGVNVDKNFARFKKYHLKYNIGYPDFYGGFNMANPIFLANLRIVEKEGNSKMVTVTPQYLLLDPNGVIVNRNLSKPGTDEFYRELKVVQQ